MTAPPNRGRCTTTGKPKLTQPEAATAARRVRRAGNGGRRDRVHEFHCTGCDWWHVGGRVREDRSRK